MKSIFLIATDQPPHINSIISLLSLRNIYAIQNWKGNITCIDNAGSLQNWLNLEKLRNFVNFCNQILVKKYFLKYFLSLLFILFYIVLNLNGHQGPNEPQQKFRKAFFTIFWSVLKIKINRFILILKGLKNSLIFSTFENNIHCAI